MKKLIFGYGSLINKNSLKTTIPNAKYIKPCFVKGFIRSFSLLDPLGFTETNLDVKGIPFCALNIKKVNDLSTIVNGVVFEMDETDFSKLLEREQEYELIETTCYDWNSKKNIGKVFLFSSNKDNGTYDFDSEAQKRYLEICLDGAKLFGDDFYDMFLETTLLEGKKLAEIKQIT